MYAVEYKNFEDEWMLRGVYKTYHEALRRWQNHYHHCPYLSCRIVKVIQKGPWVTIYQCSRCGNILPGIAFNDGRIYCPCQECGNRDWRSKSGRRLYTEEIVNKKYLFGLITRKKIVKKFVEWEIFK